MKNLLAERVKDAVRDVPDFPKPGVLFKDITPVLQDGSLFNSITKYFAERFEQRGVTKIVGIESRGFIFGSAIAHEMEVGLVLVRKPGKLPAESIGVDYELEYGTDRLEIHTDALDSNDHVAIVDDLLATGGTAKATAELVEKTGAEIAEISFLIELGFLKGREKLDGYHLHTLLTY